MVRRYYLDARCTAEGMEMVESSNGAWVKYTDYAALLTTIAELRKLCGGVATMVTCDFTRNCCTCQDWASCDNAYDLETFKTLRAAAEGSK